MQHALKYGARQPNQTQSDKLHRLFQVSNDKGRSGANAENRGRQNRSEQERKRKNAEDAAGTYRQAQPIYLVAYALQKVKERGTKLRKTSAGFDAVVYLSKLAESIQK